MLSECKRDSRFDGLHLTYLPGSCVRVIVMAPTTESIVSSSHHHQCHHHHHQYHHYHHHQQHHNHYLHHHQTHTKTSFLRRNATLRQGVLSTYILIKIISREKSTTSMETQLLHQNMEDLRNGIKSRSHQTDKLVVQLREEGIEMLSSQLDKQKLVVWIWCRTQAALQHILKLYDSKQLKGVFLKNIQPSISKVINIDMKQ